MGGQDTQWFLMDVLSWRELVTRGRYFYKFRGIDPTAHRTTLDRSHFRNKKKKKYKKERRKRKVRYTRPNRIGRLQTRFLARFFAGQKIDYFSDCFFFYFRRSNNLTIALLQEFANPAKESLFDDIGEKRLPRHRLL